MKRLLAGLLLIGIVGCGDSSLRELYIRGTQVTNAGVAKLKKALPNCQIDR